jgi:acyl carrier protein
MTRHEIETTVTGLLSAYCKKNGMEVEITQDTPLIGASRLLDSMGLVNLMVDIETAFLDEDIEINLASESAMSARISPYRSVGSLCSFIARQLGTDENE